MIRSFLMSQFDSLNLRLVFSIILAIMETPDRKAGRAPYEVNLGLLKGFYNRATSHLLDLATVSSAEDPEQEKPLIEDLRRDFEMLREHVALVTPARSRRDPVPLIARPTDGMIYWYDPQDGNVYHRPTSVDRGHIRGRIHFSSDGQPGELIPFETWVRNGGLATRVLDAVVDPVPAAVRSGIGMPPKVPVYL